MFVLIDAQTRARVTPLSFGGARGPKIRATPLADDAKSDLHLRDSRGWAGRQVQRSHFCLLRRQAHTVPRDQSHRPTTAPNNCRRRTICRQRSFPFVGRP
ncbi:hypothetical protein psal_cds_850 [Pandoravirus salinus]|uniref:Uncharacterized protein n=1 Tax=Pandoravirus salinus TaxID=1349410 RepID=S4VW82_9VIRU|nr:hypothetical protein psal_cds_850 [Pandoravirus salinus]AGO84904.2 hypothetical protein psal_cds_850 [Pandoravirus salinus]